MAAIGLTQEILDSIDQELEKEGLLNGDNGENHNGFGTNQENSAGDISFVEINLQSYEQERKKAVFQRMEQRQQELCEQSESVAKDYEDQMRIIQKKYLLETMRLQRRFQEEYDQLDGLKLEQTFENEKFKIEQEIENHKMRLQSEKKHNQLEFRKKIGSCKEAIETIMKELENRPGLTKDLEHYWNQSQAKLVSMCQDLEALLLSQKQLGPDDVSICDQRLLEAKQLKDTIIQKQEEMKRIRLLENQKNESKSPEPDAEMVPSQPVAKLVASQPVSKLVPSQPVAKLVPSQPIAESTPIKPFPPPPQQQNHPKKVHKSSRDIYIEHQSHLVEFEELCQKFLDDASQKQRRGTIKVYLGNIINSICNVSIEHLKEKLVKLLQLFDRKEFVHNGKRITISEQDYSFHFAISTAVKFFLNNAPKQTNIAFKLAPIIVILWSQIPEFGRIFLANLFLNCPYAIPYFPARSKGQTELEYKVVCGYQLHQQNQLEPEEMFQTRIFSLMELYGAIIQCNMPPGEHPRNMQYAWRWLAAVVNDEPRPMITALILDAFLSTTSHKMLATYGRQFRKLFRFIHGDHLDRIEKVTEQTERQTLMKFKSLMRDIEQKMQLRKHSSVDQPVAIAAAVKDLTPAGLVPNYFFSKSYYNQLSSGQR